MALVDMEMSAEEAREDYGPVDEAASDAPKYPYGLRISLDEEGLAKLGLTSMPAVGSDFTLTARCEVCATSEYSTQGGETEKRLELQITAMELAPAARGGDAASLLYGGGS